MRESDDLRDAIAAAIRERVRLRLGPNALALALRGEPVMLNLSEAQDAADAALAALGLDHPTGGAHRYLSTGCLHGEHAYCQGNTGLAGAKTPARCKFCKALCLCPCHTTQETRS